MSVAIPTEILEDVRRVYSGTTADAYFPLDVERSPYAPAVERLVSQLKMTEDSDPNCDVCYSFDFDDEAGHWWLRLSRIGLYATLMHFAPDVTAGNAEVVDFRGAGDSSRVVISTLAENQVELLSRPLLEARLPFDLDELEWAPTVYRALFEDAEVMPWRAAT